MGAQREAGAEGDFGGAAQADLDVGAEARATGRGGFTSQVARARGDDLLAYQAKALTYRSLTFSLCPHSTAASTLAGEHPT